MLSNVNIFIYSIDKTMHSLGYLSGYALPERHLPNPVDIVLVFSQQVDITVVLIPFFFVFSFIFFYAKQIKLNQIKMIIIYNNTCFVSHSF